MDELLAAIIGAVVGAGATLYIESRHQSAVERKAEWNALDLLMLDLGRRRVFLVPRRIRIDSPDTSEGSGFDRMRASVLSVRNEVRTTMRSLRATSPARLPLRAMYKACNRYLETIESDPAEYWIAADDLRIAIEAEARAISDAPRNRVEFIAPGSDAI
ncbi:hypothetical protein GSU68_03405 [Rathayibacter sp. VKM Ac-2759]|uniref:hypothetical protein n=1 Tax=Rathayibacter sp. VKM Ac-2759 TaxID=2609252 RepID=UPI001315F72F|nr:hypothetical protein [Rathayibacter sp. VKM Ac-2759]QHC65724.1 hypothetical protein GSU68_03405 [Rathayibacter sp. VKM Ac-2759]